MTGPDATPPQPGDLSVCMRCACLLEFAPDLTVRELTAPQLDALPLDVAWRLLGVRRAVLAVQSAEG